MIQGDLLALLFLHPKREYSLTEAAALIGVSVNTVHTEASRLVAAGFASDSRRGNVRLLRAVTGTPVSRPLTDGADSVVLQIDFSLPRFGKAEQR